MAVRKEGRRKLRETQEQTVLRIMRRIALGTWIPGMSEYALAEKLGSTPTTIQVYAREASRRISAGVTLDDSLRDALVMQFQMNASLGQDLMRIAKADGDVKTAVNALRVKGESLKAVMGIYSTHKPRAGNEDDDLSGKSERELLEIIAKSSREKTE